MGQRKTFVKEELQVYAQPPQPFYRCSRQPYYPSIPTTILLTSWTSKSFSPAFPTQRVAVDPLRVTVYLSLVRGRLKRRSIFHISQSYERGPLPMPLQMEVAPRNMSENENWRSEKQDILVDWVEDLEVVLEGSEWMTG